MTVKKRTAGLDWTDLQHFVALARRGTLSAAAHDLGVTHVTVARRVGALEAVIGKSLFIRRAGRYVLSAEGERIAGLASPMADAVMAVARAADGLTEDLTGPVRLTSTERFACQVLVPGLEVFQRQHPGIEIEMIIDQRNLSLVRREADIAVRLARPAVGEVIARRVGTMTHHFYAACSLRGTPLAALPLVSYDEASLHTPEARHVIGRAWSPELRFSTNNQAARIAAACAGFGVALLPKFVGESLAELERIDVGLPPLQREIWLLVHRDLNRVPRFRASYDFIADTIRAARHQLVGD